MQDFQELLLNHAAPCLLGIKTANLLRWLGTARELGAAVRRHKHWLKSFGVEVRILTAGTKNLLILVYRAELLKARLAGAEVRTWLVKFGYGAKLSLKDDLLCLARRLQQGAGDFPHEIGLFLDYPLADVQAFVEGRQPLAVVGAWRVYGDVERAKARFAAFNEARSELRYRLGLWPDSVSCRQMAVAQ